ncbi:MAG: hypothetical protein AABX01_02520 [Candidatus Micrarchaeota archaeon]
MIQHLVEKRPQTFVRMYNKLRLVYMGKYAKLLTELKGHNIHAESNMRIVAENSMGGHTQHYLVGISHTEPANFKGAKKLLVERRKDLYVREKYLSAFRKAAEGSPNLKLAEIQHEVLSGVDLIDYYLANPKSGLSWSY